MEDTEVVILRPNNAHTSPTQLYKDSINESEDIRTRTFDDMAIVLSTVPGRLPFFSIFIAKVLLLIFLEGGRV